MNRYASKETSRPVSPRCGVFLVSVSCCGARCAPCRWRGCVAHRPLPLARVASSATGSAPLAPRTLTCGSSPSTDEKIKATENVSFSVAFIGAGDRTRTGTLSPAADFESATSTISSHRQVCSFHCFAPLRIYRSRCAGAGVRLRCPKFSARFARKISTAAHRSGRFFRHRRRSPRSPGSHRTAIAGGGF